MSASYLDTVHFFEDLFSLAFDVNANFLTDLFKIAGHVAKGNARISGINDHHHIEVPLNDRLGYILDINLIIRQISTYFCDDADGIFSNDGDDGFVHSFLLMSYSKSYLVYSLRIDK